MVEGDPRLERSELRRLEARAAAQRERIEPLRIDAARTALFTHPTGARGTGS
jgi:hypothetical protein